MMYRMRHGRTARSKADAYEKFLTVTHWENEAAIRAFAGDDLLKAKYYAEDREFLLEFEPTVQHYLVAANERR